MCASSFVTLPLHLCFTIRGLQGLLFFLTHTLCFWSCLINAGDLPFGQGYTCHKVIACHLTRWDPTFSKIYFGYDLFSWNICSIFYVNFKMRRNRILIFFFEKIVKLKEDPHCQISTNFHKFLPFLRFLDFFPPNFCQNTQ